MKMLWNIIFALILLSFPAFVTSQDQSYNVEMFIISETGEAVVNAHILIEEETQVISNFAGFCSTKLIQGSHHVKISHISYGNHKENIDIQSDSTLFFTLSSRLLEEVEIKGRNPVQVNQLSEINVENLKTIPGILGNKDVIRSLTFLPGVSATTEGSVNFSVRGSESYQNAILIDRSQVFNISHLFGLLSTVNGNIVNDIKLYKNYIPARFGNAASSIVDISILRGNNESFKKKLEVGLTNLAYNIQGPIIKDKLHLNFSGRSAFLGLLSSPLYFLYHFGDAENYANYNLFDSNLKLSYSPTPKDRFSLHAYSSSDHAFARGKSSLENENTSGFMWRNNTLNLSYYKSLGRGMFLNNFINYSHFRTNFYNRTSDKSGEKKLVTGFKRLSTYNNVNYQAEFNYSINKTLFRLGVQYDHSWFSPLKLNNVVDSKDIGTANHIFRLNSVGLFTDNDFNFSSKLKLNFGLRINWYQNNSLSKLILEPRISLKYSLDKDQFMELSYSKLSQNKVQYPIVNFGLPLDIWIPISEKVVPPIISHFNLSYVANHFFADNLTFTTSVYFKDFKDLTTLKSVLPFIVEFNEDFTDYLFSEGRGKSYGLEIGLDYNSQKINLYLGYHLSKSFRQFEEINHGNRYPFEFNRLHELNTYCNYSLSKKWKFTSSFHFASGSPVTLATGYINVAEDFKFYLFEERNNFRNSAYHRGDFSIAYSDITKRERKRTWTFSIYNFYYRKNSYDTIVSLGSNGTYELNELSVFPIVPSLLYSLEF